MQPSDYWVEHEVTLDIFGEQVDAKIQQKETGTIDVEFEETLEIAFEDVPKTGKSFHEFEGETEDGSNVSLKRTSIENRSFAMGSGVVSFSSLSPFQVIVDGLDDDPFIGKELTVEFDMLCFKPGYPLMGFTEQRPLLSREDWEFYGVAYEEIEPRIEYIKEFKIPIRTGIIQCKQQINGPPERQYQHAENRLLPLLELLSIIQGVTPSPIRTRIVEVDGEQIEGETYTRYMSNFRTDIGCAFKGQHIVWGQEYHQFVEEAYDEYVDRLREKYQLHRVISWYLDGLNVTRPIGSRISSFANGIELLATRHAEFGKHHSETKDKIREMVDVLGVKTRDLAEHSGTYDNNRLDDEDGYHEYFYNQSRQHVAHGEHLKAMGVDELYPDYQATKLLMQRLLRNQILGEESDERFRLMGEIKESGGGLNLP